MRLTNIAQLRLPPGSVYSYGVPFLARPDRPLPVSFDQRRHVGAGDRPGSWMAIAFRLDVPVTDASTPAFRERLAAAWDRVVARHGTLRTVFAPGPAGEVLLFEAERAGDGAWIDHALDGAVADDAVSRTVRDVFDTYCRPYAGPSHRLCLVVPDAPASDPRPIVVIGSDHSHVDMWSLVVIARDLAATLADPDTPLPEAAAFVDHTRALEAAPSAPDEIRGAWDDAITAGGGLMPRFPLDLGDISQPRPEVVEVRDVLDAAGMAAFEASATALGVRVTALALATLARISRDRAGVPLRAVFPVHSRNNPRWHDAVGWFITNAVIEIDTPTPQAAAAAVRRALAMGSHPLAPILEPYGGMPPTRGMFAISWLDLRRLPVAPPAGSAPHWVSAVIRTDGVMIWFVVDGSGMHLRCRYPDTPEARASVGGWLDAVEAGIRAGAAVPAGA